MATCYDFTVIGGGIAGLTVARALSVRGASVALVERGVIGREATWTAAGMLAPVVEARLEEQPLVRFGREALAMYPAFLEALRDETGIDPGYREDGTLFVGVERDHVALLRHSFEEQQRLGLPVSWVTGYDLRELEPYLAPSVSGGILSNSDRQVNNRALVDALTVSIRMRGVTIIGEAGEASVEHRAAGELICRFDGGELLSQSIVIAPGAFNHLLAVIDSRLAHALYPIKGQVLRLDQSHMRLIDHIVRTPDVYMVPKSDGTIVVGASSEEKGYDRSVTVGEVYELLRAARACLPAVTELPIVETRVGFRPTTTDHLPIVGATGTAGVYVCGGFFRHGILFAPLAANVLVDNLVNGIPSHWLDTFAPQRFHELETQRN